MFTPAESKTFYKKFFILSVPLAVQSLLKALMYFIDNIMIGSLGEDAIVGVGNANQIAFLIFILMFGICSAAWVFAARHNGEGDMAGVKRTLGFCLVGTVFVGVVFFVLTLVIPRGLIAVFNPLEGVVKEGGDYISIVGFSYVFSAIGQSYANVLKGCEKTRLPMFTALISLLINAFLNYVLIFGELGFPALGVKGAAIGTVIGSGIDAILLVVISHWQNNEVKAKLRELFPPFAQVKPYLKQFLRVGMPVIINESLWGFFAMAMVWVYNRLGLEVAAAMAVFGAIERLAYVVYTAIGNSCGVMVGNLLGEGEIEKAHIYARRFLKMTPLSTIFVGGLILAGFEPLLTLYNITPQTLEVLRSILYTWLSIAWVLTFNYTNICGVLRGGGDAKFSLYLDLICSWLITLPLAVICGFVFELPAFIVYLIAFFCGDGAKALFGLLRFRSRKWMRDITSQTRGLDQDITNS